MISPFISKREFFLRAHSATLDRLNTQILQGEEYFIQNGEIAIDMSQFPEFEPKSVREYLSLLMRESGWQITYRQDDAHDWMLLY